MGEFYAVRVSGGKKEYYKTKADYHAGRARAQDSARKREERALGKAQKKKKQIKAGKAGNLFVA